MKKLILVCLLVFFLALSWSVGSADEGFWIISSPTGGDCSSIGTWDGSTCTLTQDLSLTSTMDTVLEIQGGDITLDCNGYKINGDNANKCVWSTTRFATNVVVKNCVFKHCHQGIKCNDGRYHIYEDNTFVGKGSGTGIVGYRIGYSDIRKNEIFNHSIGISMDLTQRGNKIYENYIHNNLGSGIAWRSSASTYDESIYENHIAGNGYGILAQGASINIYRNNFVGNTNQAFSTLRFSSDCGPEKWDIGGEGNYWSDFSPTCADIGGDGICDNPYNVPCADGVNFVQDNNPLTDALSIIEEFPWIIFYPAFIFTR